MVRFCFLSKELSRFIDVLAEIFGTNHTQSLSSSFTSVFVKPHLNILVNIFLISPLKRRLIIMYNFLLYFIRALKTSTKSGHTENWVKNNKSLRNAVLDSFEQIFLICLWSLLYLDYDSITFSSLL